MSKAGKNAWGWDPASRFPTTEWTKILGPGLSKSVMGELYSKYGKPIYSYLRHKGWSDEEAKDLVQGFFTDRVLGQQLFQKADRTRGRFRTFLLTAIRNYAIDLYRRRKPAQELKEEFELPDFAEGPEAAFNIVWAQELLQDILVELEAECRSRGKEVHWQIFRLWLLEPDTSDRKAKMSSICRQHGIDDPSKAYNMIANLKERFRVLIRRRLRRQVGSEADVDDEIRSLIDIFSESSTRK